MKKKSKWKAQLTFWMVVAAMAAYLAGYVHFRMSQFAWSKSKPQQEAPEPTFDGVKKVIFKPMELLEKLTKDTPFDIMQLLNQGEKKTNPDGPPASESEIAARFTQAHKEANIDKIRKLFFNGYVPDDDVRQLKRYFDYGISRIEFTDLPPGVTAHSNFEGEMSVTRMMNVYYGTSPTMFPVRGRFYVGEKDGRYFLMIRWGKG